MRFNALVLTIALFLNCASILAHADIQSDLNKLNQLYEITPPLTLSTLGKTDVLLKTREVTLQIHGRIARGNFTILEYLAAFAELPTLHQLLINYEETLAEYEHLEATDRDLPTKILPSSFYLTITNTFTRVDRFDKAVRLIHDHIKDHPLIADQLARTYIHSLIDIDDEHHLNRLYNQEDRVQGDPREFFYSETPGSSGTPHSLEPLLAEITPFLMQQQMLICVLKDISLDIVLQLQRNPSRTQELETQDHAIQTILKIFQADKYLKMNTSAANQVAIAINVQKLLDGTLDALPASAAPYLQNLKNTYNNTLKYILFSETALNTLVNESPKHTPANLNTTLLAQAAQAAGPVQKKRRTQRVHFQTHTQTNSYNSDESLQTSIRTRIHPIRRIPRARHEFCSAHRTGLLPVFDYPPAVPHLKIVQPSVFAPDSQEKE